VQQGSPREGSTLENTTPLKSSSELIHSASSNQLNLTTTSDAESTELKWTPKTLVLYPALAAMSGFLGGFLGIEKRRI
jgi:hypothetical protein